MAKARASRIAFLRKQRADLQADYCRARKRHARAEPIHRKLVSLTCDLLRAEELLRMEAALADRDRRTARKADAAIRDLFGEAA